MSWTEFSQISLTKDRNSGAIIVLAFQFECDITALQRLAS
ncbi:hypothetical protein COLO4_33353 [Corchorus olitorius]|uniref:Uncharacterized protein n=1 Tax=Corchorus olitorius TaxID=93759 RepID=A0A1R3GUD6_9ROSI|nr:hypothetical protein COLO4_33353 [Corchorus olitorius]